MNQAAELSPETQAAYANAELIARSIERKLPGYKAYVRHIASTEYAFFETAVRKPNESPQNEIVVAYSEGYYFDMNTNEEKVKRGRRILKDIRINMGLPAEEATA